MPKNPLVGGLVLNLPEFTWLVHCPIVIDHCLFQYLMFFSCLHGVGAGGKAWLSKTFNMLDIL